MRNVLLWMALVVALTVPLLLAAQSPLLEWRSPVYVLAGLAGIFALGIMLLQPLLVLGWMPGIDPRLGRQVHLWIGVILITSILVHVVALWFTSPPDVIDALTFRSPTPFSDWGVIAMWAAFAAASLVLIRRRLRLSPAKWRMLHTVFVCITVLGSILHAVLIEGTMEPISKTVLCVLIAAAVLGAVTRLKAWASLRRR